MTTLNEIRRVTYCGMAVNVALAAAKGVIGVICASQALVADAVHSASDLVTDFAVILGVRYWAAPADEEHPYGHGKIEALVTMFIAIALLLVAWELAESALEEFRGGATARPGIGAFAVVLVSIVSKEALFRWTLAVARRTRSTALEANAWHHRSDAMSSIPVALAVGLGRFFPSLWWVDGVGALVVVCFLVRAAWDILKPAVQELTDAGLDGKSAAVAAIAERVAGVRSVHQVRARRYGGAFQADLHVQTDPTLTVAEGHAIAHAVKEAIRSVAPEVTDAVIHIEPAESDDGLKRSPAP